MKKREVSTSLQGKTSPPTNRIPMEYHLLVKDYPLHKWLFFKSLKKLNKFLYRFQSKNKDYYLSWRFDYLDLPSMHFFMYDGEVIADIQITEEEAIQISPNWAKHKRVITSRNGASG